MNSEVTLAQLRKFLLVISAGVFVMTVTELIFLSHWTETIQFLPFALCGVGLITLALAYFNATSATVRATCWSMIIIGICSFIGFYEHMENNLTFRMEIQPNASTWELIRGTLEGANPVLAPGILLLGAVIGMAALYHHPLLKEK